MSENSCTLKAEAKWVGKNMHACGLFSISVTIKNYGLHFGILMKKLKPVTPQVFSGRTSATLSGFTTFSLQDKYSLCAQGPNSEAEVFTQNGGLTAPGGKLKM